MTNLLKAGWYAEEVEFGVAGVKGGSGGKGGRMGGGIGKEEGTVEGAIRVAMRGLFGLSISTPSIHWGSSPDTWFKMQRYVNCTGTRDLEISSLRVKTAPLTLLISLACHFRCAPDN